MSLRRFMVDTAVGLPMIYEGLSSIDFAYELGQRTGSRALEIGLPAVAAVVSVPLAYIVVRAVDRYMKDRNNFLNKILDRYTFL